MVDGKQYLKQMVNEPPQTVTDQRGRKKVVFKPRSNSIGVDYWDCEVYQLALADAYVGDWGWNAAEWADRLKRKRRGVDLSSANVAARDFGGEWR